MTGDYAGLEGYVIRIARDRRLVMDVGGMAVAISNVHAERFEEVNKTKAASRNAKFSTNATFTNVTPLSTATSIR